MRAAGTESRQSGFRADLQGLRAVAVLLVLLWHSGFTWIPGGFVGVDAFFVISGYLITGLLIKERETVGKVHLPTFYARRARRLLPASSLVIIATVVLSVIALPQIRWRSTAGDAIASSIYLVNWRFAGESVGYLADEAAESPFQHFWSLAVEEQFYMAWPLLIIIFTPVGTIRRGLLQRRLFVGFATLVVFSLAWSIYYSERAPEAAYFVATTRVWEFGIGAALVLGLRLNRPVLRPTSAAVIAWVGLVVLVISALVIEPSSSFPGWIALFPTLATACCIYGGATALDRGPVKLLGLRPLVAIGMISYSIYLWHWPLLVVADARWGPLSTWQSAAIVAASFGPAYLAFRLVEEPVRRSKGLASNRAGLVIGVTCTIGGVLAGGALYVLAPTAASVPVEVEDQLAAIDDLVASAVPDEEELTTAESPPPTSDQQVATPGDGSNLPSDETVATSAPDSDALFGALSLVPDADGTVAFQGQESQTDPLIPDPFAAPEDRGEFVDCQIGLGSNRKDCVLGDATSNKSIALIGDSKAFQWITAMDSIASAEGYALKVLTKAGCVNTSLEVEYKQARYDTCIEFNRQLHEEFAADPPDVIVVSGRIMQVIEDGQTLSQEESAVRLAADNVELWSQWVSNGSTVIALYENPSPGFQVPECVSENRDNLVQCTFPLSEAIDAGGGPLGEAAAQVDGVSPIDLAPQICPVAICPVTIGNVLVYRDAGHLTDTYVRTLAPRLLSEFQQATNPVAVSPNPPSGQTVTTSVEASTPDIGALAIDEEAEQLAFQQPNSVETIVPDPIGGAEDRLPGLARCRTDKASSEVKECILGDTSSARQIVLLGDSHAAQWASALDTIAAARSFSLIVYAKAVCPYTGIPLRLGGEEYSTCSTWNEAVRERLIEGRPELAIVTSHQQKTDGFEDDHVSRWGELVANGSRVIALADNPIPGFDVPECVSENRSSLTNCTFSRDEGLRQESASIFIASERMPEVDQIDVNSSICPGSDCPVVVG